MALFLLPKDTLQNFLSRDHELSPYNLAGRDSAAANDEGAFCVIVSPSARACQERGQADVPPRDLVLVKMEGNNHDHSINCVQFISKPRTKSVQLSECEKNTRSHG